MVGLIFGLAHWLLYTSGVRANPAWWAKKTRPDELVPEQAIGAMGQLAAAIGLLFMAIWMVIADPFGLAGLPTAFSIVLAVTGANFGFLFLGTYIAATRGYDWRPIGDAALFAAVTAVIVIVPLAAFNSWPWDFALGIYIYGILAATWGLVIHGKCSAKILQLNLALSLIVTWYFMIFGSGLAANTASFMVDVQNVTNPTGWFWFWLVIGIITILATYYTYRSGPKRQIIW